MALMIVPPVIGVVAALWGGAQLRRFARDVPVLRTAAELDRFKRIASLQMYVALGLIPLLALPLLVWLYGMFVAAVLGLFDIFLGVVLPSLALAVVGHFTKRTEKSVQQLPVEDPALRAERDRVVQVWQSQALPDW